MADDSGVAEEEAYAYLEDFREYTRTNKKNRPLIGKIRSHLLALGWEIQCSHVHGQPQYSYTSPAGKTHYSLKKLCQQHLDSSSVPLVSVDEHDDDVFSCFLDSPLGDGFLLDDDEQSNEGELPPNSHQDWGDCMQSEMMRKARRRIGKSKRESLCEDDQVWMMKGNNNVSEADDESDFTWVEETGERAKKQMLHRAKE